MLVIFLLAAGIITSLAPLDLVAGAALPLATIPAEQRTGLVLEQLLSLSEAAHVVDVGRDRVLIEVVEELSLRRRGKVGDVVELRVAQGCQIVHQPKDGVDVLLS